MKSEIKAVWVDEGRNMTLEGDGFYISYNPNTTNQVGFTEICNALGGDFKDGEETALCVYREGKQIWYILEGDFRKEYGDAFEGGLEACLEVYNKHKADRRSNWSTD